MLRGFVAAAVLAVTAIAAPAPQAGDPAVGGGFWQGAVKRQGAPAFGPPDHKVFRNVKEFGAVGDGATDDTDAINAAVAAGTRCGRLCDSTTTTPAIVYFPPGTYVVSKPLVQLYYTQFIGDATNLPVIKATADFKGMAVIDADPYDDGGNNFWVNQNNFFRQVRNFVIDTTAIAGGSAGIHWQVAQATSLQNIVFNMRKGPSPEGSFAQGIFMDNGSGGFMADLTFNGGDVGAFLGNQQYTTRNLTFNDCQTAVYMNWNWAWLLQDVKINNCPIGIDMSNGGTSQTVGSVLLLDSSMTNVGVGVLTSYETTSEHANGTLILENVDMTANVPIAVKSKLTGNNVLNGNQKVASWRQGRVADAAADTSFKAVQGPETHIDKPDVLMNQATGKFFTRVKPQFDNVPAANFLSAKSNGCMGDGKTDDTVAIQALVNKATADQIVYFDHGAYLVTDTIKIPKDIKITGEIWPVILAGGNTNFKDQANPKPVFQVGQPGETGNVELVDLMLATAGPQPGAIMIEWNVAQASQGSAGMWDVHTRIGGAAGTDLDIAHCLKNPNVTNPVNLQCMGANMLLHVTKTGSGYFENCWFWVADHDLEPDAKSQQIDIYNGRGVLIESQTGPVWMYGTASEHNVLYNYQLQNAKNVFMGTIQTETPYFQGNPDARVPFTIDAAKGDPTFDHCTSANCARAWGLRSVSSTDIFVFGAGLYSFFDNYGQVCVGEQNCQDNMVSIEKSAVHLYGLSTKAAINMLLVDGTSRALDSQYRSTFCGTMAYFASEAGEAKQPQPDAGNQGGNGTG